MRTINDKLETALLSYVEVEEMKAVDFRKGYEVCINHAICLAHDADLLAENGSFGHAFFLYFSAMEEAVKSTHYALAHVGVLEYDEKVKRDMTKHMDKTAIFAGILTSQAMMKQKDFDYSPKMPTRKELIESFEDLAKTVGEFRRLRETSLYVDLKKNKWNNPMDFPESDFNSAREYILHFISFVRQRFDTIINMPKEKLEDSLSSLTRLIVQNYLLLLKQLFEDGIITEGEYKKSKTDLEHQMNEMRRRKSGYRVFWNNVFQS